MEELVKEIADLKALLDRLLLRIEELEAENADLCRRLGQNSSNSHKSPQVKAIQKSLLLNRHYPNRQEKSWEAKMGRLTGYVYNLATLIISQSKLYEQLAPIETQIKEQLKTALVCHFDETVLRVEGALNWLHLASNDQYTYFFVHAKRGQQALLCDESIFSECVN